MGQGLSRRELLHRGGLGAAAIAAAPLLASCASVKDNPSASAPKPSGDGSTEGPRFDGQSITVLVYSGLHEKLYKEYFVPQFQAKTGASVAIDSAWTEGIARLQAAPAGRPPFDLFLIDPIQGQPAIDAGLFQQFDTAKVPNAKKFAARLLDTPVWTEGWGLPFVTSPMTLVTNTSLRPKPYQTWAELLEAPPKQGTMLYNLYYMSLYTYAAMKAEQDGMVGQAAQMMSDDIDAVLNFAVAHRALATYFWANTTDGVNAVVGGNVAAGNIHGTGLLAPIREGKPVVGIIPPGDTAAVQLYFAVPAGVRNVELSVAAMNHVASEEFQAALAGSGEASSGIPSIAAAQAAKDPAWAAAFPHTEEQFNTFKYYPYEPLLKHAAKIDEVWRRSVLRKL